MALESETASPPDRRSLLKWTSALAGAAGVGLAAAQAQPAAQHSEATPGPQEIGGLRKRMFSYIHARA